MKTPVYFISDIHLKLSLDKQEEERREMLYRLFDKIMETGGTCFFVGDLFDFYFEYPDVIPKAYADFYLKAMSLKSKGVDLHFLVGNHDYWTGEYMEHEIMDKVYHTDTHIEINDKKFYLTHGDGLLSWDHGYRLLKKVIRSNTFIWPFSWLHPTISYKIARFISRSGHYHTHSEDFNKDVRIELKQAAKKHFDNGFDYMISGHYHLGEMFTVNEGKLAVLGDWFFRPSYAVYDGEDLNMVLWEKDE